MYDQLNWIELKTKPISYIIKKLSNGKSISQYMLHIIDKVKIKRVFSLVPQNLRSKRILEFEDGGICNASDSNDQLISYIVNPNKNGYVIIFENNLKNKNDPYLKNVKLPYFTIGQEIYFFYSNTQHQVEVLKEILSETDRYPFIALVTKANYLNFSEVDEKELRNIVVSAEEILIGAYDEESYIRIEIEY